MKCRVCGDPVSEINSLFGLNIHVPCHQIMRALEHMANTPARALLHKINTHIARGVDD